MSAAHGHVIPNPDGWKARCGGPALCSECAAELAQVLAEEAAVSIWRTGRKVGRTIYVQQGDAPSDSDPLIGVMDTPELAAEAVEAVSGKRGAARDALLALAADFDARSMAGAGWDKNSSTAWGDAADLAREHAQGGPGAPSTTSPAQEDPDLTLVGLSPAQAYMAGVKAERERIASDLDRRADELVAGSAPASATNSPPFCSASATRCSAAMTSTATG